jgi:acetoin utilization protein AcuC
VVLGGGGYNPWTVARYWTGIWGRLSRRAIPRRLPEVASEVLRGLACDLVDDEDIDPCWIATLADEGTNACVRQDVLALRDRASEHVCAVA